MPSFGEKLKIEREKRKITLDQISSTTKIGTRMLQALEEDKFGQLPGGIFNKGFVRAYARTVGLDEDQTVADYLQASGEAPPPRVEPSTRDRARENALPEPEENGHLEIRAAAASRQLPWGIFALVLLTIAVALTFLSHRRREKERLALNSGEINSSSQLSVPSSGESTSVPAQSAAPRPTPVSTPIAVTKTSASPEKIAPNTITKNPQPNTAPASLAAVPLPGEFVVIVRAREESWMSATSDGKPSGSETLEAGEQRTFRGRREVSIKAGNVAGLDFLLNGNRLPVGGDFGEVRTILIGPEGLLPSPAAEPARP